MPDSGIADGSSFTSSFFDTYVRQQVVVQCTSGARPTSIEGRLIYETDTDRLLMYDGTGWIIMSEPEQTYTPAVTQSGAVASTNHSSRYQRSSGRVVGRADVVTTAAGTAANSIRITLPIAPNIIGGRTYEQIIGNGFIVDTSVNTVYRGILVCYDSDEAALYPCSADGGSGAFLGSSVMTAALANTDQIVVMFDYEMTTRYS